MKSIIFRWHIERIECSTRCGTGVEVKHSVCVKIEGNQYLTDGHRKLEHLSPSECLFPQPVGGDRCEGDCLPTRWEYDDWSEVRGGANLKL